MEARFSADFSAVRVHTDARAAELARDNDASALARGEDLFFAAGLYTPSSQPGRHLLAHELAHVLQARAGREAHLTHRSPGGELSPAQVRSAIRYTKARYDIAAQREIQRMVGVEPDGDFGPDTAQALARVQAEAKLTKVDGKLGPETLDDQMRRFAVGDMSEGDSAAFFAARYIHLVAQLHDLPVSQALSVHFEARQSGPALTRFEAGSAVVSLGPQAFTESEVLRLAIESGLGAAAPVGPTPGARPQRLSPQSERRSIRRNKQRFDDPRAVRAIQSAVGATPDGVFGPDTVERIAELQFNGAKDLVSGEVDLATLELIHGELAERGAYNAILHLMVDYFDLTTTGALELRARDRVPGSGFAPASGRNVSLEHGRSNSVVWLSHASLGNFQSSFRAIAHELAHTRRAVREGMGSDDAEEFEAKSEELLAPNLPPSSDSFLLGQAMAILTHFEALDDNERAAAWPRFRRVRSLLQRRAPTMTGSLRTQAAELLHRYEQQTKTRP